MEKPTITKAEELEIAMKYLQSKVLLRSLIKDKDLTFLDRALANIESVFKERREEIEIEAMEVEELEKQRIALIEKLAKEGWDMNTLFNPITAKRAKKKAKRQKVDEQTDN